jgi:hypothetical protein
MTMTDHQKGQDHDGILDGPPGMERETEHMTVADVAGRVRHIASIADDDERAHSEEDDLRADVLKAIRDGASDPQALAAEALKTSEIEFSRWCA